MKVLEFKSFENYRAIVQFCGFGTAFRGVSDFQHALIPSVGRFHEHHFVAGMKSEPLLRREAEAIRVFEAERQAHLPDRLNAYQTLALAQHYGLPTRLLDWSLSPLAAL